MFPSAKNMTVREWLFDPSFRLTRIGQEITTRWSLPESSSWDVDTFSIGHRNNDKKFYSNVFWICSAIRVLGLDLGIGFYYRGNNY